jgi:hypothetical protein
MNTLPLVFAFLLIFSFLTLGFIQEQGHSILAERSIRSFHTVSRAANNAISRRLYARIKSQATASSQVVKPITTTKAKRSRRACTPPLDTAKLNIHPLLEMKTDPQNNPLYEIAAELLRVLYGEVLFKKDGVEYDLLNGLLKAYQNHPNATALSDLFPDPASLKHIFYKMLKGTNRYDAARHLGIPPLMDFMHLSKGPSIHFAHASHPLLRALFGSELALKILSEEKNKNSLTQNELMALLAHDPGATAMVQQLGEQIDFSNKSAKRTTLSKRDRKSGLGIKKRL